jgi:hypothetical protein
MRALGVAVQLGERRGCTGSARAWGVGVPAERRAAGASARLVLGRVGADGRVVGLLRLPGDDAVLDVHLPRARPRAVHAVGRTDDLVVRPAVAIEDVAAGHPRGRRRAGRSSRRGAGTGPSSAGCRPAGRPSRESRGSQGSSVLLPAVSLQYRQSSPGRRASPYLIQAEGGHRGHRPRITTVNLCGAPVVALP